MLVDYGDCDVEEYFEIHLTVNQPEQCLGCTSIANYCDAVLKCDAPTVAELYSIRMIDAFGDCFYLNANNNFGVFTFPYKLHQDGFCNLGMNTTYDLVDHFNIFLNASYGHTGFAFINKFYPPSGECKLKVELQDSDLSMDRWTSLADTIEGNIWDPEENCRKGFLCHQKFTLREYSSCWSIGQCGSNHDDPDDNIDYKPKEDLVDFNISVSPTLVFNEVNIELFTNEDCEYDLTIINISGKSLGIYNFSRGEYLKQVNTDSLEPGMYFIKVKSLNTGMIKVIKFIKQ